MFKNNGMHFIHLSVNSISKKEEIDHLAELTNASVKDISLTKVDGSVLNSEMVTESCCIVLQKGLVLLAYSYKAKMCLNPESIFLEIYLPK